MLFRSYTLRLFIENEEREFLTRDHRTWTPAQRPYVPCSPTRYIRVRLCICRDVSPTSEMRAEIQMRHGHLFWVNYRQTSEVIDVQVLFNEYWSSNKHEFTVPSQFGSPSRRSDLIENGRCGYYWKAPLVSGITILCKHDRSCFLQTAHPSQLIMAT